MGDLTAITGLKTARVVPSPPGVFAVAVRGFASLTSIIEATAAIEHVLAEDPKIHTIVVDILEIDGFEPGMPARFIHWLGEQSTRVRTCFLITVSPVLSATVRAAELLLPHTMFVACPNRAEAFAQVARQDPTATRGTTGRRRIPSVIPMPRKQTG